MPASPDLSSGRNAAAEFQCPIPLKADFFGLERFFVAQATICLLPLYYDNSKKTCMIREEQKDEHNDNLRR